MKAKTAISVVLESPTQADMSSKPGHASGNRVSSMLPEPKPAIMIRTRPPTSIRVMIPAKVTEWTVARQATMPIARTTPVMSHEAGQPRKMAT